MATRQDRTKTFMRQKHGRKFPPQLLIRMLIHVPQQHLLMQQTNPMNNVMALTSCVHVKARPPDPPKSSMRQLQSCSTRDRQQGYGVLTQPQLLTHCLWCSAVST
jgi:hypothetical protein